MTEYKFTSLEAAHRFYFECGMRGDAATLETVTPCREWRVCVFS